MNGRQSDAIVYVQKMGKFHPNNLGSVVLDQPVPGGGGGGGRQSKKLWAASFRRVILDTVRCGTRHRKHSTTRSSSLEQPPLPLVPELPKLKNDLLSRTSTNTTTTLRSELKLKKSRKNSKNAALRSDKLSDLLSVPSEDVDVEVIDVQRKVEALEELKRVVKNLQQDFEENHAVVLEGAREVRRLTKDDPEARTTLALLGAIPPLVALLDAPPPPYQVGALYALLNLGIANDA